MLVMVIAIVVGSQNNCSHKVYRMLGAWMYIKQVVNLWWIRDCKICK